MKLRQFSEKDVRGKKVLVRVDFNVPLKNGKVTDSTRILAHKETIATLLAWGAKVALSSHLGRPKGKKGSKCRLLAFCRSGKSVRRSHPFLRRLHRTNGSVSCRRNESDGAASS